MPTAKDPLQSPLQSTPLIFSLLSVAGLIGLLVKSCGSHWRDSLTVWREGGLSTLYTLHYSILYKVYRLLPGRPPCNTSQSSCLGYSTQSRVRATLIQRSEGNITSVLFYKTGFFLLQTVLLLLKWTLGL